MGGGFSLSEEEKETTRSNAPGVDEVARGGQRITTADTINEKAPFSIGLMSLAGGGDDRTAEAVSTYFNISSCYVIHRT